MFLLFDRNGINCLCFSIKVILIRFVIFFVYKGWLMLGFIDFSFNGVFDLEW